MTPAWKAVTARTRAEGHNDALIRPVAEVSPLRDLGLCDTGAPRYVLEDEREGSRARRGVTAAHPKRIRCRSPRNRNPREAEAGSLLVRRQGHGGRTVSIVAMWLAVLFDGIFGADMIFNNSANANGPTVIPSVVLVALFAVIGTSSIAKRVFRRGVD